MAYALTSAVAFGVMGFLVHVGQAHTPASELVFIRSVLSMVLLAPWALRNLRPAFSRDAWFLWARCLSGAASSLCFYWNLQHASVGTSKALSDLAPMFVALLGWWLLGERLSRRDCVAIGITMLGALALQWPSHATPPLQVVLVGILGALTASMAFLALRQAAARFSPSVVVFCLALTTMVVSVAAPYSAPWSIPTGSQLMVAVGSGAAGLVGQVLMTRAYVHLRPAVASTLGLSSLLWGVLLEITLHNEWPVPGEWAAYVFILAGVVLLHSAPEPNE